MIRIRFFSLSWTAHMLQLRFWITKLDYKQFNFCTKNPTRAELWIWPDWFILEESVHWSESVASGRLLLSICWASDWSHGPRLSLLYPCSLYFSSFFLFFLTGQHDFSFILSLSTCLAFFFVLQFGLSATFFLFFSFSFFFLKQIIVL